MDKKVMFKDFVESDECNGIIWAPTQVGKSEAMIKYMELCFEKNIPVIVSTDNKSDQLEQLYRRVLNRLCGADVDVLRVTDRNFLKTVEKIIRSGKKQFVIFVMNNVVQIEKLITAFRCIIGGNKMTVGAFRSITRLSLIHDEADTITKDLNVDDRSMNTSASNSAWIEFVEIFSEKVKFIQLKRMFVTATPENVCMLYNVKNAAVFALRIPDNYVGYKRITYHDFVNDTHVYRILKSEIQRIRASNVGEAILYCVERNISDGHNAVMSRVHSELDCTVNTYNGNGITAMFRTDDQCNHFEELCARYNERLKMDSALKKLSCKRTDKTISVGNLTIADFYTICKAIGEKCVVTIGKDLIARGISYVGRDRDQPMAATTMIYKPGTSMHAVGICQAIGRITGLARTDLQRRLYAPPDVIKTYKAYNINQERYIDEIAKTVEVINVKAVIDNLEFCKYRRNIDRPKLKLKMKMTHEYRNDDSNTDETSMKKLLDRWWNSNTLSGKALRFVCKNGNSVTNEDMIEFLQQCGSTKPESILWNILNDEGHSDIYDAHSEDICLTPAAIKYLNRFPSSSK
jgi:hypothetical protein